MRTFDAFIRRLQSRSVPFSNFLLIFAVTVAGHSAVALLAVAGRHVDSRALVHDASLSLSMVTALTVIVHRVARVRVRSAAQIVLTAFVLTIPAPLVAASLSETGALLAAGAIAGSMAYACFRSLGQRPVRSV